MAVRRQRRGAVEILTIDRPAARNAIDPQTTREFDAAFDELEADDSVHVVILTGAGDDAFCAGVDLKVQAAEGIGGVISEKGGFAGIVRRNFPKPLVAAVNGHALGGGLELLLACDMAVCADHARIGATEVRFGQLADGGSLIRLPNRIPLAIAAELVLTGEPISAERAAHWGLVNAVVPATELLPAALALAELVARNSPRAVVLSTGLLYEAQSVRDDDAWALNDGYSEQIDTAADWVEGPAAFVEKRKPRWASGTHL
jgi:enoyl-CoA hydratase/carnithine racemase